MPYNYYCFIKQFDGIPVELALDTNSDKMKNRVRKMGNKYASLSKDVENT